MEFIYNVLNSVKKAAQSTGLSYHEIERMHAGNSSSVGMIIIYR